jgi:hypothetical protein
VSERSSSGGEEDVVGKKDPDTGLAVRYTGCGRRPGFESQPQLLQSCDLGRQFH